jgi:hypothetical protein
VTFDGGASGAVPHVFSCYVRRETGSTAVYLTFSNSANKVVVSDYNYYRAETAYTPPGAWIKTRIEVAAGATAYFVLPQYEEGARASSIIPATVLGAVRQSDELSVSIDNFSNTGGSFYIEADLDDWTTGELLKDIASPSETNTAAATDGANTAAGPASVPIGRQAIELVYGSGKMRISANQVQGTEADFVGDWGLTEFVIGHEISGQIRNVRTIGAVPANALVTADGLPLVTIDGEPLITVS